MKKNKIIALFLIVALIFSFNVFAVDSKVTAENECDDNCNHQFHSADDCDYQFPIYVPTSENHEKIDLMSIEELQIILYECRSCVSVPASEDYEKIDPMSIEEFQNILDEYRNSSREVCNHVFYSGGCVGSHASAGTCRVHCLQTVKCSFCPESYPFLTQHDSHNWSVGWCGQTCKTCGLIQLFHPPGGCFYCK